MEVVVSAQLNDEVEGSAELNDEGEEDKRQGVW